MHEQITHAIRSIRHKDWEILMFIPTTDRISLVIHLTVILSKHSETAQRPSSFYRCSEFQIV